jgi:hypothetical protein
MKIYQINTNLNNLVPIEVEIERKTKSHYWINGNDSRIALNTNFVMSFDTKEEALIKIMSLLELHINSAKSSYIRYTEMLDKFFKVNNLSKE